jgi:hypothetical protein
LAHLQLSWSNAARRAGEPANKIGCAAGDSWLAACPYRNDIASVGGCGNELGFR